MQCFKLLTEHVNVIQKKFIQLIYFKLTDMQSMRCPSIMIETLSRTLTFTPESFSFSSRGVTSIDILKIGYWIDLIDERFN